MFDFDRERINSNYTFANNQLYIEYGMKCQCKCEFCRNNAESCQSVCLDAIDETVKGLSKECKRVIFGGGEPLFELPRIMKLIEGIKNEEESWDMERVNFQLITNGDRELFVKYLKSNALQSVWRSIFAGKKPEEELEDKGSNCENCHLFDKIILSRHHYDDLRNQEIFNTSVELMTCKDLKSLCGKQKKSKIQLNCICQRGGIDSISEIIRFILWALRLGFSNVLFSNLDKQTTPSDIFAEKNLPPEFWNNIHRALEELTNEIRERKVIYTSSGYKTTTYYFNKKGFDDSLLVDDEDVCIVTIKEYCDFDNSVVSKTEYFNYECTVRSDGSVVKSF